MTSQDNLDQWWLLYCLHYWETCSPASTEHNCWALSRNQPVQVDRLISYPLVFIYLLKVHVLPELQKVIVYASYWFGIHKPCDIIWDVLLFSGIIYTPLWPKKTLKALVKQDLLVNHQAQSIPNSIAVISIQSWYRFHLLFYDNSFMIFYDKNNLSCRVNQQLNTTHAVTLVITRNNEKLEWQQLCVPLAGVSKVLVTELPI